MWLHACPSRVPVAVCIPTRVPSMSSWPHVSLACPRGCTHVSLACPCSRTRVLAVPVFLHTPPRPTCTLVHACPVAHPCPCRVPTHVRVPPGPRRVPIPSPPPRTPPGRPSASPARPRQGAGAQGRAATASPSLPRRAGGTGSAVPRPSPAPLPAPRVTRAPRVTPAPRGDASQEARRGRSGAGWGRGPRGGDAPRVVPWPRGRGAEGGGLPWAPPGSRCWPPSAPR